MVNRGRDAKQPATPICDLCGKTPQHHNIAADLALCDTPRRVLMLNQDTPNLLQRTHEKNG